MQERLRKTQFAELATTGKALIVNPDRPRDSNEPSGEGQTLRGRVGFRMGDRISRAKPPTMQKKPVEEGYEPKTQQTREVYQRFLSFISPFFGDQPAEVLKDALDQILVVLKTEGVLDTVKHEQIQTILGPVILEDFSKMLTHSKLLLDYSHIEALEAAESDVRISIEIEGDNPQSDNFTHEVEEVDLNQEVDKLFINPSEIDENWLWRKLSADFEDVDEKVEKLLQILQLSDLRQCENKLVLALGFDHFDLVTLLLNNRFNVWACTTYYKSDKQTQEQLLDSIMRHQQGSKLLQILSPAASAPAPKRTIDLQSSHLPSGNHHMSNLKVTLPKDSTRLTFPAFQEVTIPASVQTHKVKQIRVSDLPSFFQPAFSSMQTLNAIQSTVLPTALAQDEHMLVCAPTGAGKTNIALMAILRLMQHHLRPDGSLSLASFKAVYIAPMKALVAEICGNLSIKLEPYGIKVSELTGDSSLTKQQSRSTQVVITTPEKWDIVTRKFGALEVQLMIIDEIHLLHDLRGPVLEAVISRARRFGRNIRMVGLSATLPNYTDVAELIGVQESGLFFFDRSWRPVPLLQKYIGVTEKKAAKRVAVMNEILASRVKEQIDRQNQVLVFVHSRKETARTARALTEVLGSLVKEGSDSQQLLQNCAPSALNSDLRDVLQAGFGIHHAGLGRNDRRLVEDLFADRHLQVLVSTATLAWGVNLPAHCVVIKGTQVYSPEIGAWVEISPQDILQMIGRAGRIDYDTEGEGIIMTSHAQLPFYLSLLNTQLPIESQMLGQLADHLNAEVVLGNVASISEAVDWIRSLYLYIRMKANPGLYLYDQKVYRTIGEYLVDLAHSAAAVLDSNGLLRYNKTTGALESTALGQVSSHFYIKPESIATYNANLLSHFGPIDLLRIFSLSQEFKHMPVRLEEKLEVAKLMERVPFPIKGAQDQSSSKINILLQAYISRLRLDGFTLMSDMVYISQSASRIMRALFEICLRRSWAGLAGLTLHFAKMIKHRMWGVMSPLRQFGALSEEILIKLEKKEGLTWDHYLSMSQPQLEELMKNKSYGQQVYGLIKRFPRVALNTFIQPLTRASLRIELAISKDFQWDARYHAHAQLFWVFVEDVDNEIILHSEQFMLKQKYAEEEHIVSFVVPLFEPLPPQYFIRVVSDQWIQAETLIPVSFRHLLLPDKNLPPTKLEDLQIPLHSLRWPQIEDLVGEFNSIQKQCLASVYDSEESVLVAAPVNSGTELLAVLAGLKTLASDGKVLVVTEEQGRLEWLVRYWTRFLDALGERIGVLEGDLQSDSAVFRKYSVIFGVARNVEYLTRRWRQRTYLQSVATVVCDSAHLLGEGCLEICLARFRYISSETQWRLRIACFMHSTATAKDVADWLGVSFSHLYNLPPSARPLEITLQAFDQNDHGFRFQAMAAKAYSAIRSLPGPAVIFVPDRKVARKLGDFLLDKTETALPSLRLADRSLLKYLERGIGVLHENLIQSDRDIILGLQAQLLVIICTSASVWGFEGDCQLSVVLDTCRYDGAEHRYLDYQLPQLIEMAYRAASTALVFCHTSRKEYLKKFLTEPLPLESNLEQSLPDYFNSEISNRNVCSKQDAVDWVTWTLYYRRLLRNPNYYNLQGVSAAHINDHLSELVENTVEELVKANCVGAEDLELHRLNIGMIADHYKLKIITADTFARSVTGNTKVLGVLELLAASSELEQLPIRPGESAILREVNEALPEPLGDAQLNQASKKAVVLLMAHFSRLPLTADLSMDQAWVLQRAVTLLHGLVDTIATRGFLLPVIHTLTVCQMLTQGMWEKDSPLLQLPHISADCIRRAPDFEVEDIVDLMNMEDEPRGALLAGLAESEIAEIARVCNAYPSLNMHFEQPSAAPSGALVNIDVRLEREGEQAEVYAPFFPGRKTELWWIVVGVGNTLLAIKKVEVGAEGQWRLGFLAPQPGVHELTLYLVTDSYVGCDQGEKFSLTVMND